MMRKVLWVFVGLFLVFQIGLFLRYHRPASGLNSGISQATKDGEALKRDIENFDKEMASLIKDLEKSMAEAGLIIAKPQHLSKPTNGVTSSYHDGGYESAWTQDIDQKKGIVLVTTIDSKMSIVFKPADGDMEKFHVGWIAPVTFQCTKLKKGKCDFKSPYKLFVSNGLVEVKQLILPKK